MMKKIEHEIKIEGSASSVYKALTTLKGLEAWHSAHIKGNFEMGGEFSITHDHHPSFTWRITDLNPNQRVEWKCLKGPGNAPETKVCFDLIPDDEHEVSLHCTHEGWSDNNENFVKCNTLWGMLLNHLKEFIETGKVNPTFV